MTAEQDIEKGSQSLKEFFDELAALIVEHGVRILSGDFNMALWKVPGELLARGIQVHLAAWYPWKMGLENQPRIDSEAIFIIGPCGGARVIHDCSILGLGPPTRQGPWRNLEKIILDPHGKEIGREPFPICEFAGMGQGYVIDTYHPKVPARRQKLIELAFRPMLDLTQSAVAEFREGVVKDKAMFPFPIKQDVGLRCWEWPQMPCSRQKLVDVSMFDPSLALFQGGAHMPIMIFLGDSKETRRTPQARQRRAARADERGWRPSSWQVNLNQGVAFLEQNYTRVGGASRTNHWQEKRSDHRQEEQDDTRGASRTDHWQEEQNDTRGGGASRMGHRQEELWQSWGRDDTWDNRGEGRWKWGSEDTRGEGRWQNWGSDDTWNPIRRGENIRIEFRWRKWRSEDTRGEGRLQNWGSHDTEDHRGEGHDTWDHYGDGYGRSWGSADSRRNWNESRT